MCSKYGVSETEIISESRARDLAHIRAVITLLARELEGVSVIAAAEAMKRDSGNLSRLANRLDRKCNSIPSLKQEITALRNELLKGQL